MFPQDQDVITTLSALFSGLLGDIPPEFESLIYLFFIMFLFYLVDCLFILLKSVFEVHRWKK